MAVTLSLRKASAPSTLSDQVAWSFDCYTSQKMTAECASARYFT